MLSSKIRTAIVALAAASSFAATAVAPAASQAKPINPYRNVTTKIAVKKQPVSGLCQETREALNEALRNLEQAHKDENAAEVTNWRNAANNTYEFGYELGCGFTK